MASGYKYTKQSCNIQGPNRKKIVMFYINKEQQILQQAKNVVFHIQYILNTYQIIQINNKVQKLYTQFIF